MSCIWPHFPFLSILASSQEVRTSIEQITNYWEEQDTLVT